MPRLSRHSNSVDIGYGYEFIQNSLTEEEFVQRLDREQMKRFFDNVGLGNMIRNFDMIYDRAVEYYKGADAEL